MEGLTFIINFYIIAEGNPANTTMDVQDNMCLMCAQMPFTIMIVLIIIAFGLYIILYIRHVPAYIIICISTD